jgi:hypothetical protein
MSNTITSIGTAVVPAGNCTQKYIIYAVNSARYWAFYTDSTNVNQIKCQYSSDTVTWTLGTAFTTTNNFDSDGREFSCDYKNISSTDVVHFVFSQQAPSNDATFYVRATISGTTITYGSQGQIDGSEADQAQAHPAGCDIVIDTNNRPAVGVTWTNTAANDFGAYIASNADTGSAWTVGYAAGSNLDASLVNFNNASHMEALTGDNKLAMWENGAAAEANSMTNVRWSKYNGSTWSAAADIFTVLGAGVSPNNYGACALSTSDIHCVLRTGTNTYTHKRFNGTDWTTVSGAAITTQNSLAGGGLAMASDGTSVWLFVIDTDAPNTVRYCTWTSNSWSAWSALESTTKTRSFISCCRNVQSNKVLVGWSQTNGANNDFVSGLLTINSSTVLLVSNVGTLMTNATGRPQQNHIFYDSVNNYWWLLYYSSTQTLSSAYSNNFTSWTSGATLTLAFPHNSEGRNLGISFNNISGHAVVHIENHYVVSTTLESYHVRATISGTTISYGTETVVDNAHGGHVATDGPCVALSSTNFVFTGSPVVFTENMAATISNGTDSGTSWVNAFTIYNIDNQSSAAVSSGAMLSLGSGNMLYISDNGSPANFQFNNFFYSKWTSVWTPSSGANVLGSPIGTTQDANDWNAIVVGSTAYLIYRTGSNTYGVQTTSTGTISWATGTAPGTQTSLAGGGIGLSTDGTNLWMFVIDSASGNPIQYNKFNGTSWGGWNTLESSSQTRNNISVWPLVSSNTIGISWTQTNGSNFDIWGEKLASAIVESRSLFLL